MHVPSFTNIHWYLLKFTTGNKNTDVWWEDNSVRNWQNLSICNPKPDLPNFNAHSTFGEYTTHHPQKTIWTEVQQLEGLTDWQTHGRPTWNQDTPTLLCGRVKDACVTLALKASIHVMMTMIWRFTSLSTLLKSYPDKERVTMKCSVQWSARYKNTPIQIYWKFYHQKMKIFR